MSLLIVHLWIGALVVALAVLAVWRRTARRITLYVVTLQILIGIWLMIQGLRVSPLHPALAVVGWAGYMAANAIARRSPNRPIALIIAAVASVLLLITFGLGQHSAHATASP